MADTGKQLVTPIQAETNGEAKSTSRIVEDVLAEYVKKHSNSKEAPPIGELSPPVQALITFAAKNIPGPVKYLLGGAGGWLVTQSLAFWGLPDRVAQIEETQTKQGALMAKVACAVGAGPCEEPATKPKRKEEKE